MQIPHGPSPSFLFLPFPRYQKCMCFVLCLLISALVFASGKDDSALEILDEFVREQISHLSGDVTYTLGTIGSRSQLSSCKRLQPFFPPSARLIGNTSVGLQCLEPQWSIYIPLKIQITDDYVVTTRSIGKGQVISPSDIETSRGDISSLPNGAILRPEQALGRVARYALGAGQVIKPEQLSMPILIKQNQNVRLVLQGQGFSASAEGKALSNASEGQIVQVRTPSGHIISGITQRDGTVQVPFSQEK